MFVITQGYGGTLTVTEGYGIYTTALLTRVPDPKWATGQPLGPDRRLARSALVGPEKRLSTGQVLGPDPRLTRGRRP